MIMRKLKVGDIVQMKPSNAKWMLDHVDIYYRPNGEFDKKYEEDLLLHMACAMGEPTYGQVTDISTTSSDTYAVAFKAGDLIAWYFVERDSLVVV